MIQVINAPQANRVLLDGNNTVIKVSSSNGAGYYFRAFIYIDDVLFDEQGWSREDAFTASKDLVFLYYSYFKPQMIQNFVSGLTVQTHLKKKVSIVIKEYDLDTDLETASVTLDDFYILYNVKSELFNDTVKFRLLGLEPEVLRVPKNGKIVIPFYANTSNEVINITATLNDGTAIYTTAIANSSAKDVYLFTLDLNQFNIYYQHLYVTIQISVGSEVVERVYKFIRLPQYELKELLFANNFGYFIPVYFEGLLATESGYEVETYDEYNYNSKVYAIAEEETYTINTGNLLSNEKAITNQICNALEVYFKNGTSYISINTKTKKNTNFANEQHLYNTELQFTVRKGLPQDNNAYLGVPSIQNITITAVENIELPIALTTFTSASATPSTIQSIAFPSLPALGTFLIITDAGTDYVSANTEYPIASIQGFSYLGETNGEGTPYTDFTFQLNNGFATATATATINVNTGIEIPIAPVITVGTYNVNFNQLIFLYSNNTGSKTLAITVTDANEDLDTLTATVLGTPTNTVTATLSAENTENPYTFELAVDIAGSAQESFTVQLLATDLEGNETTRDIDFTTVLAFASMSLTQISQTGSQQVQELTISDGVEGEYVDVQFDFDTINSNQYVILNYGDLDNEIMVNLQNRRQTHQLTFDENNEIVMQILMEDATAAHADMDIQITSSKNITFDPNQTLTI